MITAFGTGIGDDFDLEKARYHKIVLMADADCGWPAHHHPIANPALPLYAAAHRSRICLFGTASAVSHQVVKCPA